MECAAECDGLCPLCLAEELRLWKSAAEPYAKTPEGLTDELQRLEEIVSHSKSAYRSA